MATKINKKHLAEAVQAAVKKALLESSHFTAMRQIQHAAATTSMEFEKTITETLGLMDPDQMQPQVQAAYFKIVTTMKDGIMNSIMDAAKELTSFPRAEKPGDK
jgi:hypothetical protein